MMKKQISSLGKEAGRVQLETVKQIIVLATNGFGLVAALAWNNVIQEVVNVYVRPFLPTGSGLVSLIIYALLITSLAVSITTQLTRIKESLETQREPKRPPDSHES